jgi:hypothetical protein
VTIMDFKLLRKETTLLQDPYRNNLESRKCFCQSEQGWPSWISNNSEKIQLLLRTPNGKFVVSLVTGHAAVLQMKLNM